jgi:hypothetical protein
LIELLRQLGFGQLLSVDHHAVQAHCVLTFPPKRRLYSWLHFGESIAWRIRSLGWALTLGFGSKQLTWRPCPSLGLMGPLRHCLMSAQASQSAALGIEPNSFCAEN